MAIDQCEPQVIRAFEKAGWVVAQRPYRLRVDDYYLFADLQLRNANNANRVIVVEVKCFPSSHNFWDEYYRAIGQYTTYRAALATLGLAYSVYLTIPTAVRSRFEQRTIKRALQQLNVKNVIVDIVREEILEWNT